MPLNPQPANFAWERVTRWGSQQNQITSEALDQLGELFRNLSDSAGIEVDFLSWEGPELRLGGEILSDIPTRIYAFYAQSKSTTRSYVKLYDDAANDTTQTDVRMFSSLSSSYRPRVPYNLPGWYPIRCWTCRISSYYSNWNFRCTSC